jgi:hypothetical protein
LVNADNNATLASATFTLTNNGTIITDAARAGARQLDLALTNNGIINVNQSADAVDSRVFLNQGTINIADTMSLNWRNGDFTNGTGGTIAGTGSGVLIMAGGTFHEAAGTTSGTEPVVVTDTNIDYTGAGGSSIVARGDTGPAALSGNMAAGQTLIIRADIFRHARRDIAANFANAGTIVLSSVNADNNATLGSASNVPVLTNTGTIVTDAARLGQRNLAVSIANNGTININQSADSLLTRTFVNNGALNIANGKTYKTRSGAFTLAGGSINGGTSGKLTGGGLFTQGNGATTGTKPVVRSGSVAYTGTGASKITATGLTGTLSGTIVAGQTFTIEASCSAHASRNVASNVTNGGTIKLSSVGCNNNATLTSPSDVPVLTNNGTITTDATLAGTRSLTVRITNNGTVNANQGNFSGAPRTFLNRGTINVPAGKSFSWGSGDFTNDAGGMVAATGDGALVMSGGTYHQGNGATTGTRPVVLDGSNVDFNGVGPAVAATSVVFADNIGGTITGNIRPNQTAVIESTCFAHAVRTTTAATFTIDGTLTLAANSCANNSTLDATGRTVVNNGTIIVDDTVAGGTRTINGTVTNTKTISVGVVALTHNGPTLTSNAAGSKIQVRVASATAFGTINSSGAFNLGGTLSIVTDSTFWPAAGQDYLVINGTNPRVGTFATVAGLTRAGQAVAYSVQYTATGVNLHTA